MEISARRLEELHKKEGKLQALEEGGVQAWEGYIPALRDMIIEEETEEVFDKFLDDLDDVMAEATVDYPAGWECGHAISFDSAQVKEYLRMLVSAVEEIKQL